MPNDNKQLGLYSGTQKMATQHKLQVTATQIYNTFTGPEDGPKYQELSQIGYIPWKVNSDGTLDVDGLFPQIAERIDQCLGLTIKKDGDMVLSGVHQLNFAGNYVYLKVIDGKLTIEIRQPLTEISRFNRKDGITDGRVFLQNQLIKNCIIPNPDGIPNIYGDWTAGSSHDVINYKTTSEDQKVVTLSTKQNIFASSNSTYFKIFVYDQTDQNIIAQFTSGPITPPNQNKEFRVYADEHTTNNSNYIILNVKDYQDLESGCTFIPMFTFDLYTIFQNSSNRFRIKIIHCDGNKEFEYKSDAILLNVADQPDATSWRLFVRSNQLRGDSPSSMYCSGLKYHTFGKLRLAIDNISGLNRFASISGNNVQIGIPNIKLSSSLQLQEYDRLRLNSIPSATFDFQFNEGTFVNDDISASISMKNAYGVTNKPSNCKALINLTNLNRSDDLSEYFDNQNKRSNNYFDGVWNSETTLEANNGLMVIPSVGLTYPYGNWSTFTPSNNPNYQNLTNKSWRFYSRIFGNGNLSTSKIKFGGTFKISGLTKQQFLSNNFMFIISNNADSQLENVKWMSLKHDRGINTNIEIPSENKIIPVTGILTGFTQKNNQLYIHWSYPPASSNIYPNSSKVCIQVGICPAPGTNILIKEISLFNLNGQKEW